MCSLNLLCSSFCIEIIITTMLDQPKYDAYRREGRGTEHRLLSFNKLKE